ncbi:disA bacterial checkpoint controller nucleotide-binding family protein [Mycobacterium xenopi 3993]|nr:disA bacterial checkpoint controller nucleotide-binding family protein [Mycobacterium xenopi 3993]
MREAISRLAPGTGLRDGLERILRGRTGALIVLGYDDSVEAICDGGFSLDVRYAPTRLRELAKMDGAVVLSTDGSRIVRANVQLVPDPSIPTDESGTRHRSAERAAIQTGFPVISVSHSMNIVTVYVGGNDMCWPTRRPSCPGLTRRSPPWNGTRPDSTRSAGSCRGLRSRTSSRCAT